MSLMQDQIEALRQAMSEKSGDHNMHQKPCVRDDVIKMAQKARLPYEYDTGRILYLNQIERFAALVAAAEREKVAAWMMAHGYATGHGGTIEDLLKEFEWQIREREREACAKVCESEGERVDASWASCAAAIRARGEQ